MGKSCYGTKTFTCDRVVVFLERDSRILAGMNMGHLLPHEPSSFLSLNATHKLIPSAKLCERTKECSKERS